MSRYKNPIDKFSLLIKLNKLDVELLKFLADSLSINEIDEKSNLVKAISTKFEEMKKEDINKFEKIIDEQIIESQINYTNEKSNGENMDNFQKLNKRNYSDFIKDYKGEKKDNSTNKNKDIKNEFKKLFDYDKFLNPGEKFYYVDKENNEWEFREKKGSNIKYYFKCSTEKCSGYGMIQKNDPEKTFVLTKLHNIPYLLHTYCNINLKNKIFKNIDFNQTDWDNENFRIKFINWYFENNNTSSEGECMSYLKAKLENKILINEDTLILGMLPSYRLGSNY